MTIQEAKGKAQENVVLAARHFKDKGRTSYTADLHALSVGLATKKAIDGGLEGSAANYAELYKALGNHSAWRQKLEKLGIFASASARTVDSSMAELEEEMG